LDWPPNGQDERLAAHVEALGEVAAEYDASAAQVALSWLVNSHGEKVVAIPGASKVHHAEQSAGAIKFRLSDVEMARLDEFTRSFRE